VIRADPQENSPTERPRELLQRANSSTRQALSSSTAPRGGDGEGHARALVRGCAVRTYAPLSVKQSRRSSRTAGAPCS
jgi:hypothetical protein